MEWAESSSEESDGQGEGLRRLQHWQSSRAHPVDYEGEAVDRGENVSENASDEAELESVGARESSRRVNSSSENTSDHEAADSGNDAEDGDDEAEDDEKKDKDYENENDEKDTGEEENEGRSKTAEDEKAIERNLLAVCNSIRLLHATSGSAHAPPGDEAKIIVTSDTLPSLRDIATILRQSNRVNAEGKRSWFAERVLLNPNYNLLGSCLIPLWDPSIAEVREDPEYHEVLLYIFSHTFVIPDKTWTHAQNATEKEVYLRDVQQSKRALLAPAFWNGATHLYQRLAAEHLAKGKTPATEAEMARLQETLDSCRNGSITIEAAMSAQTPKACDDGRSSASHESVSRSYDRRSRVEEIDSLMKQMNALKLDWERKSQQAELKLSWLRILLLSLLHLTDFNHFFHPLVSFGAASPAELTLAEASHRAAEHVDQNFQLAVIMQINKCNLWHLFELDWKNLIEADSFTRSRRRLLGGISVDTLGLWRALDFYHQLAVSLPPEIVAEKLRRAGAGSRLGNPSASGHKGRLGAIFGIPRAGAIMGRHTRFNPSLLWRRVKEARGSYLFASQRADRPSRALIHRGPLRRLRCSTALFDERDPFPQLNFQDICVEAASCDLDNGKALGDKSIEASSHMLEHQALVAGFRLHLALFLRVALNKCLVAWIGDCEVEEASLSKYDALKVLNLICWFLTWKGTEIRLKNLSNLELSLREDEEARKVVVQELVTDVVSLRFCLDPQTVYFNYKMFHSLVKTYQLRGGRDKFAAIHLRTVCAQLRFGLLLLNLPPEGTPPTVLEVGRAILEDIFRCNFTGDIHWCLRHIKASNRDPSFTMTLFQTAALLFKAFTCLGGAACVTVPTRGLGSTRADHADGSGDEKGEEESTLRPAGKLRRVELKHFVESLTDGRVVHNLMYQLHFYATNGMQLNRSLVQLLAEIVRDRGTKDECLVVSLLQLRYLELFIRILSDEAFKTSNQSSMGISSFVEWVLSKFWNLFTRNKFSLIEMLFARNLGPGKNYDHCDPRILQSIYTGYREGLDREYLDLMEGMGGAAADTQEGDEEKRDKARALWKEKMKSDKKAFTWTAEDNANLIKLWSIKGQSADFLRAIKKGLCKGAGARAAQIQNLSLQSIRDQLVALRIIEAPPAAVATGQADEHEDGPGPPLLSALVAFRTGCQLYVRGVLDCDDPYDFVLRELVRNLEDVCEYREEQAENGGSECNIPLDVPRNFEDLLDDPYYQALVEALGGRTQDDGSTKVYVVPKERRVVDLRARLKKLEYYRNQTEVELNEELGRLRSARDGNVLGVSDTLPQRRNQLKKARICGALAALKKTEAASSLWEDHWIACELYPLWGMIYRAEKTTLGEICDGGLEKCFASEPRSHHMLDDAFLDEPDGEDEKASRCHQLDFLREKIIGGPDVESLKIPVGVKTHVIGSALAAALDNIVKRRKTRIVETGNYSYEGALEAGRLLFPARQVAAMPLPASSASISEVMDLLNRGVHPLLRLLLLSLGFERFSGREGAVCHASQHEVTGETSILNKAADAGAPSSLTSDREADGSNGFWRIPPTTTLQELYTSLQYLRALTMATVDSMVAVLDKIGGQRKQSRLSESRVQAGELGNPEEIELPLFKVDTFDDTRCLTLAKAVYRLRKAAENLPSLRQLIEERLISIAGLVEKWNTYREGASQYPVHKRIPQGDLVMWVARGEAKNENPVNSPFGKRNEYLLGPLRGMREFQRVLLAILARPSLDNLVNPSLWYWSRGVSWVAIRDAVDKVRLFLTEVRLEKLRSFTRKEINIVALVTCEAREDQWRREGSCSWQNPSTLLAITGEVLEKVVEEPWVCPESNLPDRLHRKMREELLGEEPTVDEEQLRREAAMSGRDLDLEDKCIRILIDKSRLKRGKCTRDDIDRYYESFTFEYFHLYREFIRRKEFEARQKRLASRRAAFLEATAVDIEGASGGENGDEVEEAEKGNEADEDGEEQEGKCYKENQNNHELEVEGWEDDEKENQDVESECDQENYYVKEDDAAAKAEPKAELTALKDEWYEFELRPKRIKIELPELGDSLLDYTPRGMS